MVRAPVPFRLAQAMRVRRMPAQQQRFASSSSGSSEKAQETLAKVQQYAGSAVEVARKVLGPVGEKAGNALGTYRQPILYNLSVAREFLKQVYVAERLQPPTSLNSVVNAYSTLWYRAGKASYWRELLQSGEWAKIGVYAVEAYGIFKIGEMVGRRSLVGYKVE
ncbi:uncharacterized protein LAESUDRAFT_726329 [Laetiporus sulphureus 93-53]|uniref:Mitochondrial F1F0-ATP synthase g subunit n=1 Tax=Laetiporus sulphureus 93-53 TaxID=1314785 RepID=A0A165E2A1_9APHY|nr:uncharacterized protein LAESUDRAFT_726329 [Laetiporus sulphureus 93-53]KZT06106.1 hypothetical protein LAESUDRAFT_726329 [Laetiporus sulphureus 93-53]